jgi:beta-N-acetylhexosaminidase
MIPPYVAIDHEGGSVNRLRHLIRLPSARETASSYSPDKAEELYYTQGTFLTSLGIHLNLAPVVEVATDENRTFLGDRSYGGIDQVLIYAKSALDGYGRGGIGTALKHFPGNTNVDPHTGLPLIRASGDMLETYIEPFRHLLADGGASGVLMSHARVAGYDEGTPACLSRFWVTDMLRGELGFTGLVISDDVYMAALEKNGYPPEKAVVSAVEAGVDVLMISEKRFLPALETLKAKAKGDEDFKRMLDAAVCRVLRFKIERGILAYTGTFSQPEGIEPAVPAALTTERQ